MSLTEARLEELLREHAAAVDEFFHRAAQVTSARWETPRAENKWTPAQEVKHVVLAYEAFIRELRGGEGMRLYGNRFKRMIWRAIGLGSVLWRNRLPRGARAPREIRPPEGPHDQAALLAEFRARATEFETIYREVIKHDAGRRVSHPYFGLLDLLRSIQLITVHTRHHAAVLPPPGARQQIGA